jgi:alkyl hydroperoxide reductase subunit AhpC
MRGATRLDDYKGQWLVLFSHPVDFTLVCTTEFVRLVEAMRTSGKKGVATPEVWKPGDKVIVPPPATIEAAEKRMHEGYECTDWYFCSKVA